MELSLVLTDDTGSYQTILGQFLAVNIADTLADRVAAQAAATTATQQAGIATTQAGIATTQAGIATAAAGTATTQAGIATGAAATATTQAGIATGAASTATTQASIAGTAAGNASAAATLAQNWASQAAGTVDGVSYSAKYYSVQAATSASNAAATLANALTKANNLSDVANAATARSNLAVPGLASANTFSASQTIGVNGTAAITLNDISGTNQTRVNWSTNNVSVWGLVNGSASGQWQLNRYVAGVLADSPIVVDNAQGVVTMVNGAALGGFTQVKYSNPIFTVNDSSNVNATQILFASNSSARWGLYKASPSGGNSLQIQRYDSSGALVDTPFSIAFASGVLSLLQRPLFAGNTAVDTGNVASLTPGRLLGPPRVFTSSTTYTPTAGTNSIIRKIQGAGGAGGGAQATGTTTWSVATGGNAGGYIEDYMTSGFSGMAITIGAGGVAVAGANGGNGGGTTCGTLTAPGGTGGLTSSPNSTPTNTNNITAASAVTGGNIVNIPGWYATAANGWANNNFLMPSKAGDSLLGQGGQYGFNTTTPATAGRGYGAGGGAANNTNSQPATSGGNGAPGVVIIYEFA